MKANIKLGTTLIKCNIKGTLVEVDKVEFLLDFDSKLIIYKDQLPEPSFNNFANVLNTINVTSEGIYNIDVFTGKISYNATSKAEKEFNEIVNNGIQSITSTQPTKPLIEGVFTQEPQGGKISEERLKELAEKAKKRIKK